MSCRATLSGQHCLCLLPLLLAGCAALQPPEIIENRYRTVVPHSDTDKADPLILSAISSPASANKSGVKLTDLSDRAQAALVSETKGKPPIELHAAKEGGGEIVQASTITRRVMLSLRPADFLPPGDRIDAVRIEIAVAPAQAADWRITGWTQAANADSVIEVGKLTDTSASKVSASTGLAIAKFLVDASVAAEASRTRVREMQVKDTGELNAAVDASGTAWIDETAAWRVNLARNRSSIDITLAALPDNIVTEPHFTASKLWSEGTADALPEPVPPSRVELREVQRIIPREELKPICGIAKLTYRQRHIRNLAAKTFSESDDDVQFLRGSSGEIPFLLAPAPYQPLYALDAGTQRLVFEPKGQTANQLQFGSLESASAFRTWLIRALPKGGDIANGKILFPDGLQGTRAITAADLLALTVVPAALDRLKYAQEANKIGCLAGVAPPGKAEPASGGKDANAGEGE